MSNIESNSNQDYQKNEYNLALINAIWGFDKAIELSDEQVSLIAGSSSEEILLSIVEIIKADFIKSHMASRAEIFHKQINKIQRFKSNRTHIENPLTPGMSKEIRQALYIDEVLNPLSYLLKKLTKLDVLSGIELTKIVNYSYEDILNSVLYSVSRRGKSKEEQKTMASNLSRIHSTKENKTPNNLGV